MIAGAVPQPVVDVLQPVDIDEQQGQAFMVFMQAGQHLRQRIAESFTVRQAGQAVEVGNLLQMLLRRFALAISAWSISARRCNSPIWRCTWRRRKAAIAKTRPSTTATPATAHGSQWA